MTQPTLAPLYIIILNWNLPGDTITCVRSVLASIRELGDQAQIVVVDNGSTDDSLAQLRAAFDTQIQLAAVGRNLGFAGGMNWGMRYALDRGAAAVMLLNNDTEIDAAMIPKLLQVAAQKPTAGILAPVIYYYDQPQQIWQLGDKEQRWLPIPRRVPAEQLALAKHAPFALDYVTGCCLFLRRSVLEQVGLFDERYFMYFEEADLCRRIRNAGYEIWCVPTAQMWHKVATSAQKDRPGQRYWRNWGKIQFFTQYPHGKVPWLVHPYLLGRATLTTVSDLLAGNWSLLFPLWAGVIDGYRGVSKRGQRYFAQKSTV